MGRAGNSLARSAHEVCLPVIVRGERRRHERHTLRCHCWIETPDLTVFGPVHDIGAGGLFVRTGARLEPGTRVELCVQVDGNGEALEAVAIVARSEPRGYGLPVRGLGLELQRVLRGHSLLRTLLTQPLTRLG
jgi:hypothetical protein